MAQTRAVAGPDCPCESGRAYAQCCKPLHDGAPAADAEALMRARYSAYALRMPAYLRASWDASTRPPLTEADLDPATRWLGLRILARHVDGEDAASVEFVARYRIAGGSAQRLHERSRFRRVAGRWYYLDGEQFDAPRR